MATLLLALGIARSCSVKIALPPPLLAPCDPVSVVRRSWLLVVVPLDPPTQLGTVVPMVSRLVPRTPIPAPLIWRPSWPRITVAAPLLERLLVLVV